MRVVQESRADPAVLIKEQDAVCEKANNHAQCSDQLRNLLSEELKGERGCNLFRLIAGAKGVDICCIPDQQPDVGSCVANIAADGREVAVFPARVDIPESKESTNELEGYCSLSPQGKADPVHW